MNNNETILTKLGKNIYNHFIENTIPGKLFLLLLDPFEYENIKEKTGNRDEIDYALKATDELYSIPTGYIAIAVASLQVQLIYDVAIEKIDDSFYPIMKGYYSNLKENSDVQRYFEGFQEDMWENVKEIFANKNIYLEIPERKHGSGRYVQYPKSQRLITWNDLTIYANKFRRINLEPHQMLSFSDFCNRVYNSYSDNDQNERIKKFVFSFYNNWDGQSTEELRKQKERQKTPRQLFLNSRISPENKLCFTLKIESEEIRYYFGSQKKSEDEVKNQFQDELLSFLYDEEYEEWIYIDRKRQLHSNDRLLVLANKSNKVCFEENYIMDTEYYKVYRFEWCNNDIAGLADISFVTKEYFTIIGGIRVINRYHFCNDVLGAWYDFTLPKIRIDLEENVRVFIDSNEIVVDNNHIDLANLTLKENNKKWQLESREKEYSLKCTDLPPVYFLICDTTNENAVPIEKGWKITATSLRPIKSGESPDITGLQLNYALFTHNEEKLRPFLSNTDYLQNRFSHSRLHEKISRIEKRRIYGI